MAPRGASELERALAQSLARLRAIPEPLAREVVRRELGAQLAASAPPLALARSLTELAAARRCLGCGACCHNASPTLYLEDAGLVAPGGPLEGRVYTLRVGEMVYSHRLGRAQALDQELIKVREVPGGACVCRRPEGCAIYETRPRQCGHLECWSGRHAGQLAHLPRLTRREVLANDPTAWALAQEFEHKLPAAELAQALDQARGGSDQAPALALMALDHRLRAAITARHGYPPERLDLILGRPAREVARGFGLELALGDDDQPVLRAPAGRN